MLTKTNINRKNQFLLLFLLLSSAILAQNCEKNFIDQNYIEVSGNVQKLDVLTIFGRLDYN
jgi:hypothetical protein